MISVACLGPGRVLVDGEEAPAELLWRKNFALLVYLARSPRGRSRDHLIGLLWPERDDGRARHSLNEALRVLRRSLGDGLRAEADSVSVAPGLVVLDVDHLDQLDPPALAQPFLEGFTVPDAAEFEHWLAGERERVRGAQLAQLLARGEQAVRRGRPDVARERAETALALNPHSEPAMRLLMQAHALEGSRSLALARFERWAALLKQELGLAPDRETAALAERVRRAEVVRGAPAEGAPAESLIPLFGTGPESLSLLWGAWEAAAAGRARIAAVLGDPGTGKSRLLDELAARVRLAGGAVVAARALSGDTPESVWRAWLLGGLAQPELAGAAPEVLAGLARIDSDLAQRFPASRAATPVEAAQAIAAALLAVADQRPVMITLDDAQHAPAEALALLEGLAQRAGDRPALIALGSTRLPARAEVDRIVGRIGRDLSGVVISNGSFDEDAVRQLVDWAFPSYADAAAGRLARRVLRDTAGNPFLAVELVRAVRDGLRVSDDPERPWPSRHHTLDDTRPGDLPESVGAALRLRFQQLPEPARNVLAAVAVLGGGAGRELLASASGVAPATLDATLDQLEWSRWLVSDARGYSFTTRLAGEVVLQDMVTGGMARRIRERASLVQRAASR